MTARESHSDGSRSELPETIDHGSTGSAGGKDLGETAALARNMLRAVERPTQIGRYRILRIIGEGGMGTVYEAEQEKPRRTVALKVITPGLASPQLLKRFEQESQVLGRLQHPGIAQIYEAGMHEITSGADRKRVVVVPYFAMELIRGRTLKAYVETKKLGTLERLGLVAKVCDAAHHAHQKGVIHRDLKPSNILVDESGQPKILDFGVARATDSDIQATTIHTDVQQLIGTLPYMSPEQVSADPNELDTRSDVYALGVVAYELLAERLPYDVRQKMLHDAVRVIREEEPTPLSTINRVFRGDVETIVAKALEKDKARRYQSAAELAADIRRYLHHEPIVARPASAAYQFKKFAQRNKAVVVGVAAVFLVLVAGIIVSSWQAFRATRAEGLAGNRLVEAQRQTKIAQEVNRFLNNDLLAAVDPERTSNREITMREVLDKASERIEGKFEDEPLIEASIRSTLSQTYQGLGLYEPAEKHLREAEAIQSRELGREASVTLQARSTLADLLRRRGWFLQAESLARETLEVQRRVLGDNDAATAFTLDALGQILQRQGKYAEAVMVLRQAMESRSGILGDEHSETLMSMSTLAKGLLRLGKCDEAEVLHRLALKTLRRDFGEERPRTLASMIDLGAALECQGKLDEAETVFRQAMRIQERILGEEHPDTLQSMFDLACLAWRTGRLDEAEELLKSTVEARRRALGVAHLSVASTTDMLLRVFRARAKYEEARPYALRMFADFDEARKDEIRTNPYEINAYSYAKLTYEPVELRDTVKALVVAEKLLEMKSLTPSDYRTLSIAYEQANRLDDAIEMQRNALAMLAVDSDAAWGWFGEVTSYPGVVYWRTILTTRLINTLRKKADNEAAEAVLRQAVEQTSAAHGEQRAELVREMMELAVFLAANDRFLQHEWFSGDIAEVRKGVIPRGEPGIAGFVVIYAQALVEQGRFVEAEPYLRPCLRIQELALAESDWHIAHTKSVFGAALAGQHRFADAEPLLLDGYRGLSDSFELMPDYSRDGHLRSAHDSVVSLYKAWDAAEPGKGYAEKAAAWRAKVDEASKSQNAETPKP